MHIAMSLANAAQICALLCAKKSQKIWCSEVQPGSSDQQFCGCALSPRVNPGAWCQWRGCTAGEGSESSVCVDLAVSRRDAWRKSICHDFILEAMAISHFSLPSLQTLKIN
jgi:hypothetical protein